MSRLVSVHALIVLACMALAGCQPVPVPEPNVPEPNIPPAVSAPVTPPPPAPRPDLDGEWHLIGLSGYGEACLTIESDQIVGWSPGCELQAIEQTREQRINAADEAHQRCVESAQQFYNEAMDNLIDRGSDNPSMTAYLGQSLDESIARCADERDRAIAAAESDADLGRLACTAEVTCAPFNFVDGVVVWDVVLELLSGVYPYRIAVTATGDGLVGVMDVGLGLVEQGSVEIIMHPR